LITAHQSELKPRKVDLLKTIPGSCANMGNSWDCCGKENPCDHTEDETKGLLNSSESKTSTRAGTDVGSPISDEEDR